MFVHFAFSKSSLLLGSSGEAVRAAGGVHRAQSKRGCGGRSLLLKPCQYYQSYSSHHKRENRIMSFDKLFVSLTVEKGEKEDALAMLQT